MARGLRAFAAVAEILGLVPSTYMEAYTMQDAGDLMFSSGLPRIKHTYGAQTCKQAKTLIQVKKI